MDGDCGPPARADLRALSILNPQVDAALEKHREYSKPHVKSMQRATTDVRIWNPSTDPMARGSWTTTSLYYIAIECTESGWKPPPRDEAPITSLDTMQAYV